MRITLTKKKNSISIQLQAQGSQEGVDLKDIVLGMGQKTPNDCFEPIIKGLAKRGYRGGLIKETRATTVVEVHRPDAARKNSVRSDVEPRDVK